MSFIDAREHGAKPGSGGVASLQQEVELYSNTNSLIIKVIN